MTTVIPFKRSAEVEAPELLPSERAGTIARVKLAAFRSYPELALPVDERPVALTGANGAGKTNLLEALSLFSPGRGLRGAKLAELGHRPEPQAEPARGWAISAKVRGQDVLHDLGTGHGLEGGGRREGRINGETAALSAFGAHIRLLWLTPAMDRLFVEGPSERRRFLDRLALSLEPAHASHASAYGQAMRERNALLRDEVKDAAWLSALEKTMAAQGIKVAASRVATVQRLVCAIAEQKTPFPQARLSLCGAIESKLTAGIAPEEAERELALLLAQSRARDAAAGRALEGPHVSDLRVAHQGLNRAAEQCSTGEQKALLVGLVLAQARLVAAEPRALGPILLLDEIAAHLDEARRVALCEAILSHGLQAWLTGTDAALFAPFGRAAQHFTAAKSRIVPSAKS